MCLRTPRTRRSRSRCPSWADGGFLDAFVERFFDFNLLEITRGEQNQLLADFLRSFQKHPVVGKPLGVPADNGMFLEAT